MTNERAVADHRRTTFSAGPFDLTTRRDGRSDVWCATWYDAHSRTVRHRSLRTRDIGEARQRLVRFAEENGDLPSRKMVPQVAPEQVYFIGGDVGAIKIGSASDPTGRLVTLQCGSPIPLRILAQTNGGRARERKYHAQYADSRLHGEWFERTPELLAEIDRLKGSNL